MRSNQVLELPYGWDEELDLKQIQEAKEYNIYDCNQTRKFFFQSKEQIEFREFLSQKYNHDFTNDNDTKIGKQYFIMQLEDKLGQYACFHKERKNGKKQPRQSPRSLINLKDIIFSYIEFERKEFKSILKFFQKYSIQTTKKVFTLIDEEKLGDVLKYCDPKKSKGKIKDLNVIVDNFKFVFGTGGLHACVEPCTVEANEDYMILDLDVTSYYPSMIIANRLFPGHFSEKFCDIFEDMKNQRIQYEKGTPENAMLKLALNGTWGDSNNHYGPFYDPQFSMTVTVNGQLLLCMLAELLMKINSVKMIQANTDGITVSLLRSDYEKVIEKCDDWEMMTGLDLEYTEYEKMFIRDVNNYIAVKENGDIKRKGAYEYEREWYQNQSALIVPKAVEAYLVENKPVGKFISGHKDFFDFFLRTKVPKKSRLELRRGEKIKEQLQNITRYYICNHTGGYLIKIMPPLMKGKPEREIAINKGFKVLTMNKIDDHIEYLEDLNIKFYTEEAMKMIEPLRNKFDFSS